VFGEEMKRSTADRVAAVADPLFSSRVEDQPLLAEIDKLKLGVPPLPKKRELTDPRTGAKFEVRYTPAELHEALKAIGPIRRERVGNVVKSKAYEHMPAQAKTKALRRAIEDADDEYYARDDAHRIRERIRTQRDSLTP
jgi:hypothetical protein